MAGGFDVFTHLIGYQSRNISVLDIDNGKFQAEFGVTGRKFVYVPPGSSADLDKIYKPFALNDMLKFLFESRAKIANSGWTDQKKLEWVKHAKDIVKCLSDADDKSKLKSGRWHKFISAISNLFRQSSNNELARDLSAKLGKDLNEYQLLVNPAPASPSPAAQPSPINPHSPAAQPSPIDPHSPKDSVLGKHIGEAVGGLLGGMVGFAVAGPPGALVAGAAALAATHRALNEAPPVIHKPLIGLFNLPGLNMPVSDQVLQDAIAQQMTQINAPVLAAASGKPLNDLLAQRDALYKKLESISAPALGMAVDVNLLPALNIMVAQLKQELVKRGYPQSDVDDYLSDTNKERQIERLFNHINLGSDAVLVSRQNKQREISLLMVAIDDQLNAHLKDGYKDHNNGANGDCLFLTFAHECRNASKEKTLDEKQWRDKIFQELNNNPRVYKKDFNELLHVDDEDARSKLSLVDSANRFNPDVLLFRPERDNYAKYCGWIAETGHWGGDLEIAAFARLNPDRPVVVVAKVGGEDKIRIVYNIEKGGEPLIIYNNGGGHFLSKVPKPAAAAGGAGAP